MTIWISRRRKDWASGFSPRMIVPLGDKVLLESERIEGLVGYDPVERRSLNCVYAGPALLFSGFDRNETLWGSFLL
jgi:hypothetical protein